MQALHDHRPGRLALTSPALVLAVSVWLVALYNFPLWAALSRITAGQGLLFRLSLPLVAVALVHLCLAALAWGRASKPVLCAILLGSAPIAYFMHRYGALIDVTMVANAAQTDAAEVRELLHWELFAWVAVLGVAPCVVVAKARVRYARPAREIAWKIAAISGSLLVVALTLAGCYQDYASLLRTHRELRFLLVPTNYLDATYSYFRRGEPHVAMLTPVGVDAVRKTAWQPAARPTLTVLVVGETARAANFALNGYARDTTPSLAAEDVVNYANVHSCGTNTAVSLPCMFQSVGREAYDDSMASRRENLLDVLKHAGYAVWWRDNNSGCKGVCDRVERDEPAAAKAGGLCADGECYDEILLDGLQRRIDALDRDAVIVLHMKGSHGPAYYRRYPAAFEAYSPVCATSQLARCEREAIVNAYDNTIRYTDHVLGEVLALLKRNAARFDASMVYVSDHGESLGERGLYLHGLPRAIAPEEQTHVPMVVWLSEEFRARHAIDYACLKSASGSALSHDNLFHSVLGLLDVQTAVYRASLDIFAGCRAPDTAHRHAAAQQGGL